tara:strand:- start:515 stop:826 length:312 start_codon:yes stop_codon:yes gene_type:complete
MDSDKLNILRKIDKKPKLNQRNIASELGLSLGKVNYSIKELKKRGLIKINNFKNSNKKINYMYVITPKGMIHKTNMVIKFMKIKMQEYEDLKKDLKSNIKIKK